MSVRVTSWVWDHAHAEGNDLLVLLAMADWSDDEGFCFPTVEKLSAKTRISESTVKRCTKALILRGVLHREDRRHQGLPNRYRVIMESPTTGQIDPTPEVTVDPTLGSLVTRRTVTDTSLSSSSHASEAREVVTAWWDDQKARGVTPAVKFIALCKVVEKVLDTGISVSEVQAAIPTLNGAWTTNAFVWAVQKVREQRAKQVGRTIESRGVKLRTDWQGNVIGMDG